MNGTNILLFAAKHSLLTDELWDIAEDRCTVFNAVDEEDKKTLFMYVVEQKKKEYCTFGMLPPIYRDSALYSQAIPGLGSDMPESSRGDTFRDSMHNDIT